MGQKSCEIELLINIANTNAHFDIYEIIMTHFKQVLIDIESQLENAVHFMYDDEDEKELEERKNKIITLISDIRKGLNI